MKPLVTMRKALEDPDIFGKVFAGDSWAKWRVLLIAIMGEELTEAERMVFQELTEREREPLAPVEEFWGIIGRRSGKTRACAVLGAYIAALCDFSDKLAPGERASLPILSLSLWQAGKCFQYLDGIFSGVPALKQLVIGQTADTISLATRVDIECRPASFRTIRSGTACAIIADEVAIWRSDESANPDSEILNAGRLSLATTGGPLICISTPYAQKGEVYEAHKKYYGINGDPLILVAKAASQVMNETLPAKVVKRAYERDPASAASEYGTIEAGITFRHDIETFVAHEVVDDAVALGRHELPPVSGTRYFAFVDPSGGSSDSMTLAIAHLDVDKRAILDAIRERRPPFSPESVVDEFSGLLKSYGLHKVTGDRYPGEWPRERFREQGITYESVRAAEE